MVWRGRCPSCCCDLYHRYRWINPKSYRKVWG